MNRILNCVYCAFSDIFAGLEAERADFEPKCSVEVRAAVEDIALLDTCLEVMINLLLVPSGQITEARSNVLKNNLLKSKTI
jgi:hypothetical protein